MRARVLATFTMMVLSTLVSTQQAFGINFKTPTPNRAGTGPRWWPMPAVIPADRLVQFFSQEDGGTHAALNSQIVTAVVTVISGPDAPVTIANLWYAYWGKLPKDYYHFLQNSTPPYWQGLPDPNAPVFNPRQSYFQYCPISPAPLPDSTNR